MTVDVVRRIFPHKYTRTANFNLIENFAVLAQTPVPYTEYGKLTREKTHIRSNTSSPLHTHARKYQRCHY